MLNLFLGNSKCFKLMFFSEGRSQNSKFSKIRSEGGHQISNFPQIQKVQTVRGRGKNKYGLFPLFWAFFKAPLGVFPLPHNELWPQGGLKEYWFANPGPTIRSIWSSSPLPLCFFVPQSLLYKSVLVWVTVLQLLKTNNKWQQRGSIIRGCS